MIMAWLLWALATAADGSGAAPESPWVGFSLAYGPESKGPSEAGVLDARSGRVLWRREFEDYVWVRAWRELTLVTAVKREGVYACEAFETVGGAPRFRAEGRLWEVLPGPRSLLVFAADGRLVAIEPGSGRAAWTIRLRKDASSRLARPGGPIIARSGGTYSAYAVDDGRALWETAGLPSEHFVLAGGRIWAFPGGGRRPVEIGLADGRPRETPELPTTAVRIPDQRDFVDVIADRCVTRRRGEDLSLVWSTVLPETLSYGWGNARNLVLTGQGTSNTLLLDGASGKLLAVVDQEEMTTGSTRSSLDHPRYFWKAVQPANRPARLRLFERADGRPVWDGRVDDYEEGWTGDAFLVRMGNELRLIGLPSGAERWRTPIDGDWTETERRAGRFLIATRRRLAALGAASGREDWSMDFARETRDVTLTIHPPR